MRRRGAAMIEMALALAVIGPLMAGAAGFAHAFYVIHTLQEAVWQAAKAGAQSPVERVREAGVEAALAVGGRSLKNEHVSVELIENNQRTPEVRAHIQGYKLWAPGGGWTLEGNPAARMPWTGPAASTAHRTRKPVVLSNLRSNSHLRDRTHP